MRTVTWRSLLAHRRRLVLTVIAVMVSVAFMSGTQVLTDTIGSSSDRVFADIHRAVDVVVRAADEVDTAIGAYRPPIPGDLVDTVRRAPGVVAVDGRVENVVTLLGDDGRPLSAARFGPPTYGMNWLTTDELNGWQLSAGRPPAGPDEVVVDRRTAERGDFEVGDEIGIQVNRGLRRFTLVGVAGFGTTPDYAGSPAALFETTTAQELLAEPGRFNRIEVAGAEGLSQEELRSQVAAELPVGMEAVTGEAFTRESQDVVREIFDAIGTVLLAFALVSVFVGSFVIANTFAIIVAARTREVALLRALGASRRQVLGSVALEALVVGVVASAAGLAAGIAQAAVLRAAVGAVSAGVELDELAFRPDAFASSFAVGVAITVAAALLPAVRAARTPPVAALRRVAVERVARRSRRLVVAGVLAAIGAALLAWGLYVPDDRTVIRTGAGILAVMLAAIAAGPAVASPLSRLLGRPLSSFSGRLARANAARNPRRTAATASALMIGVALIAMFAIVVRSLGASIVSGMTTAFTSDLIVDSGAFPTGGLDKSLAGELEAQPGVADVLGFEAGLTTVGGQPAQVIGVDPTRLTDYLRATVHEGDLSALQPDEVAVPLQTAQENRLSVGSLVPMTTLEGGERIFHVAAVYEIPGVGGLGYLMSSEAFATSFPPVFQVYYLIHVRLEPGADAADVRARLEGLVAGRYATASVVEVEEYGAAQADQLDSLLVLVNVLLLLAVLVAGLGIVNTLLLSVHERTREIGLLRAVGMSREQVRAAVRWESVIVALQGTVVGMAVGGLFAWALVTALSRQSPVFGVALPWLQLAALPVGAVLAGVVAAVLPARAASRLPVIEALDE